MADATFLQNGGVEISIPQSHHASVEGIRTYAHKGIDVARIMVDPTATKPKPTTSKNAQSYKGM